MRYFKVRVECVCEMQPGMRSPVTVRTILVAADDRHKAADAAVAYADRTARMGPLWKSFTMLECAPVELPMELGSSATTQKGKR